MEPDRVQSLTSLRTPATAVTAARPAAVGAGVDLTPWLAGAGKLAPRRAAIHIQADGADRTIASPTGGTAGFVEMWVLKTDPSGNDRWWLAGFLPTYAGATIAVVNPGGYMAIVEIPAGAKRLHIAGTPSGGAPTFYVEPVEEYV